MLSELLKVYEQDGQQYMEYKGERVRLQNN